MERRQTSERNNGRLAMVAIMGILDINSPDMCGCPIVATSKLKIWFPPFDTALGRPLLWSTIHNRWSAFVNRFSVIWHHDLDVSLTTWVAL